FRGRNRLPDQRDLFGALDDPQALGDQRAVLKAPAGKRAGETAVALIGGRGLNTHDAGRPRRFANERPGILVLFPASRVADDGVALDALDLERRANDDRRATSRNHQEDQPLAAPGIVAGEVLEVRAGLDDEEIELPRFELLLSSRDALREDLRTECGSL